ncbi:hypothetical protein PAMP_009724 [Pampus punctatissimus]
MRARLALIWTPPKPPTHRHICSSSGLHVLELWRKAAHKMNNSAIQMQELQERRSLTVSTELRAPNTEH